MHSESESLLSFFCGGGEREKEGEVERAYFHIYSLVEVRPWEVFIRAFVYPAPGTVSDLPGETLSLWREIIISGENISHLKMFSAYRVMDVSVFFFLCLFWGRMAHRLFVF